MVGVVVGGGQAAVTHKTRAELGDPLTVTEERLIVALTQTRTVLDAATAAGISQGRAFELLRDISIKLGVPWREALRWST